MKLFDYFKKKEKVEEVKQVEKPKGNNVLAISSHQKRIDNLKTELEQKTNELEQNEISHERTNSERDNLSEKLIRRMSLIKYEIDIREGLIKWLS